jgi:RimJ/RimL family protein N-acetyltransferase
LTEINWPLRIETERLILRALEPGDYQAWYGAMSERLPKQHKYDDDPIDLEQFDAKWLARVVERHQRSARNDLVYNWIVFHKQTNQHLGKIDLSTIQRRVTQWANLGYGIHNQFWRQGFAKEAVIAVLKAGFEQLHYHRIEAAINLDNQASIALVESLGLQKEGIRRGYWYENEQWVDHLVYAALPGDLSLPEKPPQIAVSF